MPAGQVLIAGAGPTGLVLAVALKLWGVEVQIVDRATGPALTSRALGCQPRSMEVLEALGVLDEILALATPIHGSRLRNEAREIARFAFVPPDAPWPHLYVFAQTGLERVLNNRLAALGVAVEWNCSVEAISQRADGITATLADGRVVEAGWLIGCDGAHSSVRRSAGIAFEGTTTGQTFYLSDLELEHGGRLDEPVSFMGSNGPLMLMPLPEGEGHWRVFVDVTDESSPERVDALPTDYDQAILDARGFGPGLIRVVRTIWRSLYRVQLRLAASYRAGRVFLAGDAAHVFPPFGGQGMNTGIQDASNLAWKLALTIRGMAARDLLDTYEAERRSIGRQVLKSVEGRRQNLAIRSALMRRMRDLLLKAALASAALRRRMTLAQSQLALSYRGLSWLAARTRGSRGPCPGDRAPDGPYAGGRLMPRFNPAGFTLLAFGGGSPPRPLPLGSIVRQLSITAAEDPDGALARRYGAACGALVLVRPDGHVGYRGASAAWDGLAGWLARAGGLA